jgi:cytochrome b
LADPESEKESSRQVEVRDLPVRVFHWSLVLLILFSWWSAEQRGNWIFYHLWSGYAILALLLFRIGWGFAGSEHARFSDFLYGPRAVLRFIRTLPGRQAPQYAGYHPLGGWIIVLILTCLLLQAVTGLFANDDIVTEGPLYHWVNKETSDFLTTVHKYNFDVFLALAGTHIAAQLFYLGYKSTNLIKPMFTGRKALPESVVRGETRRPNPWLAAVLLCASGAVVYLIVRQ